MTAPHDPDLQAWVHSVAHELGLDPNEIPVDLVLELARQVAHQVVRAGAPVTAYLLGLAVGHGRVANPQEASERIAALIAAHSPPAHPATGA